MVISVRKWLQRFVFIAVFVMLTIIVSGGYRWLIDLIIPQDPYRVPNGAAVKAFGVLEDVQQRQGTLERLRWFYWLGE